MVQKGYSSRSKTNIAYKRKIVVQWRVNGGKEEREGDNDT